MVYFLENAYSILMEKTYGILSRECLQHPNRKSLGILSRECLQHPNGECL